MNEGQLTGKIVHVLPVRKGTSKSTGKEFYVAEYVVETDEDYPTKVDFTVFGEDRVKGYDLHEGDYVQITFYVTSREYNQRWYTDVRVRNIVKMDPNQMYTPQGGYGQQPGYAPQGGYAPQSGYGSQQPPQGMPGYGAAPAGGQPYGGAPTPGGDQGEGVDDLPF